MQRMIVCILKFASNDKGPMGYGCMNFKLEIIKTGKQKVLFPHTYMCILLSSIYYVSLFTTSFYFRIGVT